MCRRSPVSFQQDIKCHESVLQVPGLGSLRSGVLPWFCSLSPSRVWASAFSIRSRFGTNFTFNVIFIGPVTGKSVVGRLVFASRLRSLWTHFGQLDDRRCHASGGPRIPCSHSFSSFWISLCLCCCSLHVACCRSSSAASSSRERPVTLRAVGMFGVWKSW